MKDTQYIKRYKLPSGEWRYKVSFSLYGFRVRNQNFATIKEAKVYRDKIRLLILTGEYQSYLNKRTEVKESSLKLSQFVDVLNKQKLNIRDTTKKSYWYILKTKILPLIGSVKIDSITEKHFSKLYSHSITQGISTTSVRFYFAVLSFVLRQAKDQGLISKVPRPIQRLKRRSRDTYLTKEEIKLIYDSFDSEFFSNRKFLKVAIVLQLETFIRVGELLGLEQSNVCLNTGQISIIKQFNGLKKVSDTKNSKVHKSFPLSDYAVNLLREYMEDVKELKFLFPAARYFSKSGVSSKNKEINRLDRSTYHYFLKKLATEIGLDEKKIHSHAFRKAGGDSLIRSGFSVHQTAFLLRVDPITALRSYSSVDIEHTKEKLKDFTLNRFQSEE